MTDQDQKQLGWALWAGVNHFRGITKLVELGNGSRREVDDFMLTRHAFYLLQQNGRQ